MSAPPDPFLLQVETVSGDPSHRAAGDDHTGGPESAEPARGDTDAGREGAEDEAPGSAGAADTVSANDTADHAGDLIQRLSGEGDLDSRTRRRLLRRLSGELARRVRTGGVRGAVNAASDLLIQVAPRIPVRDLETLREHHRGLTGEQLADALTRNAARATAAVGAAGGALAAVEFAAPPLLLSVPVQLAAETIVVAAIEVKLIAELHEVYGVRVPGRWPTRAGVFLGAWAKRRGVDPLEPYSMTVALGMAARTALRKRLMRTFGRHFTTLGPFLTGAIAGATLNRAATRRVAQLIRDDLRRVTSGATPGAARTVSDGAQSARPALPEPPEPPALSG